MQFDNFVVTGGTISCHYENLRCHQWQQSCQIDDLWSCTLFLNALSDNKTMDVSICSSILLLEWCYQINVMCIFFCCYLLPNDSMWQTTVGMNSSLWNKGYDKNAGNSHMIYYNWHSTFILFWPQSGESLLVVIVLWCNVTGHSRNGKRQRQNGRHFQTHFLERKYINFDSDFTEVCSQGCN